MTSRLDARMRRRGFVRRDYGAWVKSSTLGASPFACVFERLDDGRVTGSRREYVWQVEYQDRFGPWVEAEGYAGHPVCAAQRANAAMRRLKP